MKITGLNTAVIEANYDWTFIHVYTDEDITGLGESFLAPGLTGVIRDLAPLLVGEDPRNVDKLWSKMRWAASGPGSMGGIVYNAISGIEAALWDAVGKYCGVPIYQLLGGKYRDRIRIYADCHAGEALEALDSVMVARRPQWLPEETETPIASEVNPPVHGRAFGEAEADEIFKPEMYASRAREVAAVHKVLGDMWRVASVLEALSETAGTRESFEGSARLFGAADVLRETIGTPVPPCERAEREHVSASARARMGDEAFSRTRAEGRAMTLEEAVSLALEPDVSQATATNVLSVREIEILELVAVGLTDAEIARRLYLSPRTVGQHLRSVYRKLDVRSRTAATRAATERGLISPV